MSTTSNPQLAPKSAAYGEKLARRLLERCDEQGYAPGGRLPTERSLAAEFGVTRTMIRHALSLLEAEGRISREVGRGTFLRAPQGPAAAGSAAAPPPDSSVGEISPADVMAARRLIEPQVLPLVVAWATGRDFDELERCLEGGAGAHSYEEFEGWDLALHHALVVASRNQLLVAMYTLVERTRKGAIWGSLKRRSDSRERRAIYQAQHVELVGALRNRETAHAVAVMETHLAGVQTNLLESATLSRG